MDATHLHLVLSHFPVLGSLFGLLLLAYGLFKQNESIIQTACFTFVVIAVISIPVFLSGSSAEGNIEYLFNTNRKLINEHEQAAEYAIWIMTFLGLGSFINLLLRTKKKSIARKIQFSLLIISFITFMSMAFVGLTGGKIRHTELRSEMDQRFIGELTGEDYIKTE